MNVFDYEYFIWGTGEDAVKLNSWCSNVLKQINVVGYIDSNPKKANTLFYGKKVYPPSILKEYVACKIIIITSKYRNEIIEQIKKSFPSHEKNIVEKNLFKRLQIIGRYKNSKDPQIQEILDYLLNHPLTVFNYEWNNKYNKNVQVFYDDEKSLFYTWYKGNKMYISRTYDTEEKAQEYIASILLEQDEASPHLYITESFNVDDNSVVVDAGVGEGNFALDVVERVKHIYLFEPDSNWVEALKYTFEPFGDKVSIIEKGVSDYVNANVTTLDDELKDLEVNFLKMDVEGEELNALKGAKNLLERSSNIKCLVCTYHQEYAHEAISVFLRNMNFELETSQGYMYFPTHEFMGRPPILRRGLLRAVKGE